MRADLRTLRHGAGNTLPPGYFALSALQAVARQVQRGDRHGALRRFHREVRPAERPASRVADAEIESLTARTGTLRTDAEAVELRAGRRLIAAVLLLTGCGLVAGLIITRRSVILALEHV